MHLVVPWNLSQAALPASDIHRPLCNGSWRAHKSWAELHLRAFLYVSYVGHTALISRMPIIYLQTMAKRADTSKKALANMPTNPSVTGGANPSTAFE